MMTSPPPPTRRRFLPQPVETTSRSSKRRYPGSTEQSESFGTEKPSGADVKPPAPIPRRILPQPVEQSARSSTDKNVDVPAGSAEDLHKTVNDTNHKDSKPPRRRFAPEPVETTSRTSRRKFAPEPVETSTRSSKERKQVNMVADESTSSKPRRRFAPEPVETTSRRRRKSDDSNDSPPDSSSETSSKVSSRKSSSGRKFTPELIETAKGQYRHYKKENGLETLRRQPSPKKSRSSDSFDGTESRFSAAALAKRQYEEKRRHSYCVPNLPMIESDSGGEDSPTSPRSRASSDNEHLKLEDIPEVRDGSYMDYVYSLADRNRLQEQAMAAYINEVPHIYLAHFAAEEEDDEELPGTLTGKEGADPKTFRRSSQDELDLEMMNMRKHHEQLEKAKEELAQDTAGVSRFSAAALAARHHLNLGQANSKKMKETKNEKSEMSKMRAAASPPMAGTDIIFPQTISPKMTRCDVDQAPRPRRADSDDEPKVCELATKLWSANVTVAKESTAGLWMGMCQKGPDDTSRPTTPIKSGLQTPAFEGPNPFDAPGGGLWGAKSPSRGQAPKSWNGLHMLSLTPIKKQEPKDEFINSIDKKLEVEQQIDDEFPNKVVTQIYNYLSLGYPSLARPFDEELSKISRISVEDLRKDDKMAQDNARGYIGAPESEGTWEEDEQGALQGCRRWEALRMYIREWARQSPNFASDRLSRPQHCKTIRGEAWGATVRRGSWAQ